MNIVLIFCLLFVVAKAERENGLRAGPHGIENTFLDSINPGHTGDPIMGRFVYTLEDGQQYEVFYFADVYGYQAQGRLIAPSHPLASSINRWNMRIMVR